MKRVPFSRYEDFKDSTIDPATGKRTVAFILAMIMAGFLSILRADTIIFTFDVPPLEGREIVSLSKWEVLTRRNYIYNSSFTI